MVFIHFEYVVRFSFDIRLHYDDATAFHQLQTKVGRTHAMAYDDIQILKHIHR